ncbi:MAG: transposase [Bdellovibrionales bacterium]|nr:transposase [Bdellovibrionales bacterium]
MKQGQFLLSQEFSVKKEFGGALLKRSHAKNPRPISTKNAMHLTLRSSRAKGRHSFLANRARQVLIESKIREMAKKFGVSIYKLAIVGNHIHLLLRATSRRGFISFLRAITGIIARIVLGAERGRAQLAKRGTRSKAEGFWDQRPWTRVIAWMRDFANVKKYVKQNFREAMGFVPYKPRKKYSSTA